MKIFNWAGPLSADNVVEVAETIRAILVGKRYTIVEVTSDGGYVPKVETGCKLEPDTSPEAIRGTAREWGSGLTISDQNGVYCVDSGLMKEDDPFKMGDVPWIRFEHFKVTIFHKSESGNRLCWVFAAERG